MVIGVTFIKLILCPTHLSVKLSPEDVLTVTPFFLQQDYDPEKATSEQKSNRVSAFSLLSFICIFSCKTGSYLIENWRGTGSMLLCIHEPHPPHLCFFFLQNWFVFNRKLERHWPNAPLYSWATSSSFWLPRLTFSCLFPFPDADHPGVGMAQRLLFYGGNFHIAPRRVRHVRAPAGVQSPVAQEAPTVGVDALRPRVHEGPPHLPVSDCCPTPWRKFP